MVNHITFIVEQEKLKVEQEIGDCCVSVIFDGMTQLGEALVVVIHYLDDDWKLQQCIANIKCFQRA